MYMAGTTERAWRGKGLTMKRLLDVLREQPADWRMVEANAREALGAIAIIKVGEKVFMDKAIAHEMLDIGLSIRR